MSVSGRGSETFQDKVCRHFEVPPARYGEIVLNYTLYPTARCLLPLLGDDYLEPDRTFIAAVGRLTRWRGFSGEARGFQHDARNRLFLRRVLRLRVSVTRMRVLFSEVWHDSDPAALDRARDEPGQGTGSFLIE